MIIRCGALIVGLAAVCGGQAEAAQASFRNITWPRHDRKTGIVDWELRARTAEPTIANDQYRVTQPEVTVYKVVEKDGRWRTRKDLTLRADSGTYIHGREKSFARLDGHVVTQLFGEETVELKTSDATIRATADAKTEIKTRVVETRSKVVMASETRQLIGEGATIVQKTTKDGAGDKSIVTVHRNVTMEIRGAGASDTLPVVPGVAGPQEKEPAGPVTVTCLGPLVFDRLANTAVFQNQVALERAGTTLHSDELTLRFEQPEPKKGMKLSKPREAETEKKDAAPKLASMVAKGSVAVIGKDQRFSGDRFAWTPKDGVGVLTGSPARMTATGSRATADKIEFNQQTQSVEYTGNAAVEIELKPE